MDQKRTDWERLFEECATNRDYRSRLDAALAARDRAAVSALLKEIGVSGEDVESKMAAMTPARQPLVDIAEAFDGEPVRLAP